MDGERFRPAVKQLEEKEALACGDLIRVVNDEDVVRPRAHHPGQSVLSQEGAQVVVSDPAVLPATFGEVVQEHVEDLVSCVVIGTVEEKLQKPVEDTQRWVARHKETQQNRDRRADPSERDSLLKGHFHGL